MSKIKTWHKRICNGCLLIAFLGLVAFGVAKYEGFGEPQHDTESVMKDINQTEQQLVYSERDLRKLGSLLFREIYTFYYGEGVPCTPSSFYFFCLTTKGE